MYINMCVLEKVLESCTGRPLHKALYRPKPRTP